jgi:methylase of polypeptide subunit release factors
MAREVADEVEQGVILDIGTGSAIPLIHAIGTRHYGFGIDKESSAIKVAVANAKLANLDRLCVAQVDMKHVYGSFSVVISNPPYIPSEGPVSDEALEVLGDGTSFIDDIFHQFATTTSHFVIHFSSISNPVQVFQIAAKFGFVISKMDLGAARFGDYTSEVRRLAYLLRCRDRGESIFHTLETNDGYAHVQLLITCHFIRDNGNFVHLQTEKICSLLRRFGDVGLSGLGSDSDEESSIRLGVYSNYPIESL